MSYTWGKTWGGIKNEVWGKTWGGSSNKNMGLKMGRQRRWLNAVY